MAGEVISRRRMLANVGLVAGGALLGTGCTVAGTRRESGGGIARGAGSERPWYELDIIGEWIMDNQLLWYLSHTGQGMADIGECLDTASRIEANDESSWFGEWLKTADRVRRVAEESLADGHKLSAGETYLRAANYYRAALIHYSYREDPRVLETSRRSVACFEKAITLLSIPAQAVKIPYEGTTLPGYFFRSPVAAEKAPVLIVHQGFDAWPEETGWVWDGAIKRGYHCLLFHGPGQGRLDAPDRQGREPASARLAAGRAGGGGGGAPHGAADGERPAGRAAVLVLGHQGHLRGGPSER